MAIGFVQVDTHHRSAGHSVAAAMAYRAGLNLHDVRTGEVHDYSRRESREEIAHSGIAWSRECPLAEHCNTLDDAELWQHLATVIENREKHPRARILRDVKTAIPHELNLEQKKQLAKRIGEALAMYADTVVPFALHAPNSDGDDRNWHTHHVLPTRALTEHGDALGAKLRSLDLPSQSGREIAKIRNTVRDCINEALRDAGIEGEVRMGQRLDQPGARDIPAEVLNLARKQVAKRTGKKVRMAARELVDLAVANGDIEPFDTAAPKRKSQQRRTVRGSRSAPGYRRERRSRAFRDRAIERKIQSGDPLLRDMLTEPDQEAQHGPPTVTPVAPEPAATPEARPARKRRRRARRDAHEPTEEQQRTTTPRPPRKRRRRAPRGETSASMPPPPRPVPPRVQETRLDELDEAIATIAYAGEHTRVADELQDPDDLINTPAPEPRELTLEEYVSQRRHDLYDMQRRERERIAQETVAKSQPPAETLEDYVLNRRYEASEIERKRRERLAAEAETKPPAPAPRIQAHAGTDGRAPDRAQLRPAEEAERERQKQQEQAWRNRLDTIIDHGTQAMGEAMIRAHAGHQGAHPALPDIPRTSETGRAAEATLSRHVKPFLVEPRHRRTGYYHDRAQHKIGLWRQNFERVGQRIVSELARALWPPFREQQQRETDEARARLQSDEAGARARRDAAHERDRARAPGEAKPMPRRPDRSRGPGD